MNQLAVVPPSGLGSAHDGSQDPKLVELWLSMKTSPHTRRAYAAEVARFLAFVNKPLSWVTLTDLQAWADHLGQGSLKPASHRPEELAFLRPGDRLRAVQCGRCRKTPA